MKNKIHANRSESRVRWLSVTLATLLVIFGLPTTIPTSVVYASPLSWTQTTYDDFDSGSQKQQVSVVDIGSGDGDVKLAQKTLTTEVKNWPTPTENVTSYPGAPIWGTNWVAQTFTANTNGKVDSIVLYLSRNGIPGDLVVELRNTRGSSYEPGDTILTSATIPSSQVTGSGGACEVTFPTLPPVTNGTGYAIVLHQLGNAGSSQNSYYWYFDRTPGYGPGIAWTNNEGGESGKWSYIFCHDLTFIVNILLPEVQYYTSGYLVSSVHNTGCYALFDNITWNADVPTNTTLKFQIATNNDNSTWNFLGPDGTNSTFYTTNGSAIWSGHDGNQYIKYKAYFQTSDTSVTPILHDISITYEQYDEASRLELEPAVASNVVGTDHTLTATVYDQYNNPVSNEIVTWTIESGPGSFTSTETTTDTNGQAEAVITSKIVGVTTVNATVGETIYDTATKTWTADELYQFVFDTIPSPQTAGVAFSVNITATDQFGNTVTSYTGSANLTDLSATISPTVTGDFTNGLWTGDVTITANYTDDTITATGTINNSINGTSNPFDVTTGATISGVVFNDVNGNGQKDIGENGIGGVTVELIGDGTHMTTTAGDGSYIFTNVTPGTNVVKETDPAGYFSTTHNEVHISVALGNSYQVNFGDALIIYNFASIYGIVFEDTNGNSLFDYGEEGIQDVSITLDDSVTTTTGTYGGYSFPISAAGTHTVVETDPAGYYSTTPNEVHVEVVLGNSYQVDFADFPGNLLPAIGGLVYNAFDGSGISGVTINLKDSSGTTIESTETRVYGEYIFTKLAFGDYTVEEINPPNYTSVTPDEVSLSVNATALYQVNFGDIYSPPLLHHIKISPPTATIIAGTTQTYNAAAYDQFNNWLADVTQWTAFSINAGAGGNWSNNIYTSQNSGSWTVTGNLTPFNMTDTASLTVSQPGPGPGPGPEPEPEPQYNGIYFVVDFLGKITQEKMSIDGSLLNPLKAPSPDGVHLLEMEEGTRTLDDKDEIVTLIEIREAETPELPPDTSVVGNAYDFKPPDITFDKSIILTLGYDVNDLPENVESVVLAYYTLKSGWVELETKKSGVVAEVGTISAPVSHFTIFAVLAKTTPPPPVTSVPVLPPPATFKLSNLSIMPSWSKVWEIPTFVVRTGEEATISVEVTNHGGKKGSYTALLKINGIPRETKDISLNPGQTEKVSFIVADNEPGIYVVSIGDLSGEFVSILWINWWLIGGLIIAFVLICWLVWYYYKKKRQMPVNY